MSNTKVSRATWWLIEGSNDYRSGCYATRAEARFRLRQMSLEDFYATERITRQADDFFICADGTSYRVAKV